MSRISQIALLFGFLVSCNEAESPIDFWQNHTPFEVDYLDANMERLGVFASPAESRGTSTLIEASGLAYSRKNPGHVWSHQDKNNDNRFFLLDANTGETVAAYRIPGTRNRDWEDIEIANGPDEGVDYLYIGDVGDNDQVYPNYTVYRFEEPQFEESHRGQIIDLDIEYDEIKFVYPEKSHDVESLMVDPLTKDIYLATKRDFRSILFVLPYPQILSERSTAIEVGSFSFTRATAGTVSKDGMEVLIKNYDRIYYWKRNSGQSFLDLMSTKPSIAPYNPTEAKGEAICFDHDGGYYTLSEFSNAIIPELYYYKRLQN
ncbi:putative integral membrane protein, putative [Indibacter alkaliphilus LW1]|uniref:Integral membrane protein, putative n=1 Tax=Indibacter alkaliphilus (strain CCUG 57479 / KCTC 22604 / LW1) TaxID=1189612 RepID=S2DDK1_INDAL|nr:hypothetical protein [Indibacter alkaliphilus]EOZ96984.1 putative integral membrane protein, putative [Indibacter alkaliphilus LW1]